MQLFNQGVQGDIRDQEIQRMLVASNTPVQYNYAQPIEEQPLASFQGGRDDDLRNYLGSLVPENNFTGMMPQNREPAAIEIPQEPVMQMSNKSFQNKKKFETKETTKVDKEENDFKKQIADYMSKREQIAIDTEGRLSKLDAQQMAKGPNLSALMAFGDSMAQGSVMGGGASLQDTYKASGQMPLNPEQQMMMKQKLQGRAEKMYGGLTKDARAMQYQDFAERQLKQQGELTREKMRMAAGKSKKPWSPSAEQEKQLGFMSTTLQALDSMEDMLRTGTGEPTLKSKVFPDAFSNFNKAAYDNFGHLQTGAAISADEQTTYRGLLPQYRDSHEMRLTKIKQLRESLMDRHNKIINQDYKPFVSKYAKARVAEGIDWKTLEPDALIEAYRAAGGK